MPSGQILYLMMFVGNLACTSHVLQYSSSSSYEHSRSLQSSLCPGVVTVLICSFFVAALLLIYRNLENGGKIIHIFTNRQTFSYLFCIFSQFHPRKNWIFRIILVFFHHPRLRYRLCPYRPVPPRPRPLPPDQTNGRLKYSLIQPTII